MRSGGYKINQRLALPASSVKILWLTWNAGNAKPLKDKDPVGRRKLRFLEFSIHNASLLFC